MKRKQPIAPWRCLDLETGRTTRPITVDYDLLTRQRKELAVRASQGMKCKLLEGLLNLIEEIEAQKPFQDVTPHP